MLKNADAIDLILIKLRKVNDSTVRETEQIAREIKIKFIYPLIFQYTD